MGFFGKLDQLVSGNKTEEDIVPSVSLDQVKACVEENMCGFNSSLAEVLQKYKQLNDFRKRETLDRQETKYLHEAMLSFVNRIPVFSNKQEIIEFVSETMQYTRTDEVQDVMGFATDSVMKLTDTAAFVGKVVTLGKASDAIDTARKVARKKMTSNDLELAKLWENKLNEQIKFGKKSYCGLFGGDSEFGARLNALKKQLESK